MLHTRTGWRRGGPRLCGGAAVPGSVAAGSSHLAQLADRPLVLLEDLEDRAVLRQLLELRAARRDGGAGARGHRLQRLQRVEAVWGRGRARRRRAGRRRARRREASRRLPA
eukprot:2713793-Prymnesium_polylepis.1